MLADLMFRKNEYDSAMFHFQQLLQLKAGRTLFCSVKGHKNCQLEPNLIVSTKGFYHNFESVTCIEQITKS